MDGYAYWSFEDHCIHELAGTSCSALHWHFPPLVASGYPLSSLLGPLEYGKWYRAAFGDESCPAEAAE